MNLPLVAKMRCNPTGRQGILFVWNMTCYTVYSLFQKNNVLPQKILRYSTNIWCFGAILNVWASFGAIFRHWIVWATFGATLRKIGHLYIPTLDCWRRRRARWSLDHHHDNNNTKSQQVISTCVEILVRFDRSDLWPRLWPSFQSEFKNANF